jgi:hypothetical protein
LKYQYGITIEQYHAMHARQSGKCAICGSSESKLVVDHNHKTGKVCELLCHLCNAMIGCAREDIAILVNAAVYLYHEQHPDLENVQAVIAFSERRAQ